MKRYTMQIAEKEKVIQVKKKKCLFLGHVQERVWPTSAGTGSEGGWLKPLS